MNITSKYQITVTTHLKHLKHSKHLKHYFRFDSCSNVQLLVLYRICYIELFCVELSRKNDIYKYIHKYIYKYIYIYRYIFKIYLYVYVYKNSYYVYIDILV